MNVDKFQKLINEINCILPSEYGMPVTREKIVWRMDHSSEPYRTKSTPKQMLDLFDAFTEAKAELEAAQLNIK